MTTAAANSSRVIAQIPKLGWGKGRECTFLGALEAALAATEHPMSYVDLMGFTGLAFRTRWWKATEKIGWCASCAVGEMREELEAADRASGWPLIVKLLWSEAEREAAAGEIVRSIDARRAVLAYDAGLNMGTVYGYEDGGRVVCFERYRSVAERESDPSPTIAPAKLGWMWVLLGEHRDPPPREQLLADALRMIVHNFRRGTGGAGPGEYWYGPSAFEHWAADLRAADSFNEEQRKKLFFVSWWNFDTLSDARGAAMRFLERNLGQLPKGADDALRAYREEAELLASTMCEKKLFLGPWTSKTIDDWSGGVRDAEARLLQQLSESEAEAIAAIAKM